jgi:hypothetical protein
MIGVLKQLYKDVSHSKLASKKKEIKILKYLGPKQRIEIIRQTAYNKKIVPSPCNKLIDFYTGLLPSSNGATTVQCSEPRKFSKFSRLHSLKEKKIIFQSNVYSGT